MRLAVSRSGHFEADIYCANARAARKILREKPITVLAIDYQLAGTEQGGDVLNWADAHNVLPACIVIVAQGRAHRLSLASSLDSLGFRSSDRITFFR